MVLFSNGDIQWRLQEQNWYRSFHPSHYPVRTSQSNRANFASAHPHSVWYSVIDQPKCHASWHSVCYLIWKICWVCYFDAQCYYNNNPSQSLLQQSVNLFIVFCSSYNQQTKCYCPYNRFITVTVAFSGPIPTNYSNGVVHAPFPSICTCFPFFRVIKKWVYDIFCKQRSQFEFIISKASPKANWQLVLLYEVDFQTQALLFMVAKIVELDKRKKYWYMFVFVFSLLYLGNIVFFL